MSELVAGVALMDETWETLIAVRLAKPLRVELVEWSIGRVDLKYEPVDQWNAWKAGTRGPLTLCLAASSRSGDVRDTV